MKISQKEIGIINLCLPHFTEFGEINFDQLSEELGKKGVIVPAEILANILMKQDFAYKDDCITISGHIAYQYFLTDSGRMLFSAQNYQNYLVVKKEEVHKRKIRLSRSSPKDWLDTKFIRMAAFLLFAVAVFTFAVGDRKIGGSRHREVENQNSLRFADHPKITHRR